MIAILTACYGKHEIFKAFLAHLPNDAYLICVGDDDKNKESFEQSQVKGTYIIHPNKPISKKWNYGLQFAKSIPFEYLVITGSDDFFCADLWAWYKTLTVHYAGLLDIYFMEYATGKIKYNEGFLAARRGEPHGAGRALHRNVLETINWKLWDDSLNAGLDASATATLNKVSLSTEFIRISEKGFVAIDVKTKENIHKINEYQGGKWLSEDEKWEVLNKIGWS